MSSQIGYQGVVQLVHAFFQVHLDGKKYVTVSTDFSEQRQEVHCYLNIQFVNKVRLVGQSVSG